MTNDEIEITLDLLEELTDYQASAGCNDFWFPKSWSKERVQRFEDNLKEYQKGEDDDEYLPDVSDSSITYYLMGKLEDLKHDE